MNLGCKVRISSGLDWVFEQVEEAIILEDDCLPHQTFFRFCEEMLKRYCDDQRIGMVSGDNFQFGYRGNKYSYYFSRYCMTWGWATWRDRWVKNYDVSMWRWSNVNGGAFFHIVSEIKEKPHTGITFLIAHILVKSTLGIISGSLLI